MRGCAGDLTVFYRETTSLHPAGRPSVIRSLTAFNLAHKAARPPAAALAPDRCSIDYICNPVYVSRFQAHFATRGAPDAIN